MIICPNCKSKLIKLNNTYKCINNHSFDISKEGYINLLLNKPNAGDNKQMIKSRKDFLELGYFDKLLNTIIEEIKKLSLANPHILDLGCADGYYTNSISKVYPNIIGLDISKEAIKYAAKNYKDIIFIVGNAKEIPIKNNSIDLVINIFSPLFIDEINRVLKDNSYLIKVTPNSNHMLEIKEILYDKVYLTKEKSIDDSTLLLTNEKNLSYKLKISNDDIINLFTMTPYSYKTSTQDIEKLKLITSLEVTLDFNISIYKKHSV